ncbi:protein NSP-INTERACTING KINASE 2-like [Cornus florida]|uniref:protein NSP-INTERACTING KINASE 2-like n=1 Tax=Cornus florida TaxID=4283 RepID=UPI00289D7062|nr:protein NSP-INTERACTING KINASE 2-like [Cornus florida]
MGFSDSFLTSVFLIFLFCLQTVCGNTELRALMEIKSSLDPENKYLSSWTSDGDPCSGSFDGVACNEHRKVANISLVQKKLSGKISPALAGLKCLSGLYLNYNSLYGEIPKEISNLTELSDLYLDVNNLSGTIPPEIGKMASLQALVLSCNQLTGNIPTNMGSLKKLRVLYLENNSLNGPIPASLANIPQLEVLDVQNNSLSGVVPPALKRLNGGFRSKNNPGLCGFGFSSLRDCTGLDGANTNNVETPVPNNTAPIPESADVHKHCNQSHCSNSKRLTQVAIVAGVIILTITLMVVGFLVFIWYRRGKQKIGSTLDASEGGLSTDQTKEIYRRSPSPLVSLDYCDGCSPLAEGRNGNAVSQEFLQGFKFNLEDVESATQYFSGVNLLGKKSNFSAVYKGILKDGSIVAIRSITKTCCKSDEMEFMKGLKLLTSLKHENLVRLRGFCCSKARGECFLIYDFAPKGNLSQYLDVEGGSSHVLDWSTRVSIISGIARGIGYLHSSEPSKPGLVHRNISVEKVLIDQRFNPLILDSGLLHLLADDVVFSALKVSAALGYMAPEYITTGRFTVKSDVYAFGVIILQILSGERKLTCSMRLAAESCRFEDFIDSNLQGKFSEFEASKLVEIALLCTHELPDNRPTMDVVIEELRKCGPTS